MARVVITPHGKRPGRSIGVEGCRVNLLHAIDNNGAIPAVMLDAGFPLAALKGISLLARTASLIGHLQEESERPIGFIMAGAAADRISYLEGE